MKSSRRFSTVVSLLVTLLICSACAGGPSRDSGGSRGSAADGISLYGTIDSGITVHK